MRKNFNVKKKASIILSVKLLNSYAILKKFWIVSQYWLLYLQTFCSQIDNTSKQEGFIEGNFKKCTANVLYVVLTDVCLPSKFTNNTK